LREELWAIRKLGNGSKWETSWLPKDEHS